jgi:CHAT domain-containing protein
MKLPVKRILVGTLAGVLLLVTLFLVWLVRGPFFLGSLPKTNVPAILHRDDPRQMLQAANHLSWIMNWPKAGPLYHRAEILFASDGDARDALYAHVGYIRSQAESRSFPEISQYLGGQIQTPLVRQHPRLRLWCLVSKGYTDNEIDVAAAQIDWENALKLAQQLGEHAWANRASGELGLLAFLEGNPLRAGRMVGRALITARATGDVGAEIRYLELLGDGFTEIDRQDEALAAFDKAINLARATPDAGSPFMGYEGKSESLMALHRYAEARALLQRALLLAEEQSKFGHAAQIELLLGELALKTGDRVGATGYFEEANKVAVPRQYYRMAYESFFDLAEVYRAEGRLDKTQDALAQAVGDSRKVGDAYYLPRNLEALAELKAQAGHMNQAHALYEQAEDVVDGMLANSPGPYTVSSVLSAMSSIYLGDFALAARAGDAATAFSIIERARGRAAADMLRNRSVKKHESPAEHALEQQISAVQLELMRSEDPKARATLLDSLLVAEEEFRYDNELLRPALHLLSTQRVTLAQFQRALQPNESLFEYVLAEPRAFCLAVSHDEAAIIQLPDGRKQIETQVSDYLANLNNQTKVGPIESSLYSVLLAPIPERFRLSHLIIIPDGQLNRLPFEALRDPTGDYLVRSHVVFYAPSATTLYILRTQRPPTAPQMAFLGVGGISYQPSTLVASNAGISGLLSSVLRGFDDLAGVHLNNLPATRQEIIDASRALGARSSVLLIGNNATKTAFEHEPLGDFSIIHFAAHAVAVPKFPERSALILGRAPHSRDDGLLQARDIAKLNLDADLVTLSACDTANGKLEGEEGVTSLLQAFLLAGAKSVLASVWKVDDASTATLMKQFYTHIAEGEGEATALRDAELDLLNQLDNPAPAYWAGFILTGDGSRPITLPK